MTSIYPKIEVLKKGVETGIFLTPVSAPTITMNSDSVIKTSFSGEFLPDDRVNFLTDTIKIYLVENDEKFPIGDFVITTEERVFQDGKTTLKVEGYDKCYLAQSCLAEDEIFFKEGTLYLTAIKSLLHDCGINWVISDDCPYTFSFDRAEWETGTSYLEIINQLLTEINFETLFFDSNGFAVLRKKAIPTSHNIKHIYNSGKLSVIRSDASALNDNFEKYNVFIAVSSTPEQQPLKAISVNDSPILPTSTVNLGRRVAAPIYRLNTVPDLTTLQDYIDNIRFRETGQGETVEFETALSSAHSIGDIIAINHEHINGIFREISWNMTISAGSLMKHKAKKIIIN